MSTNWIIGTTALDVRSQGPDLTATVGNTSNNAIVQFYDLNTPYGSNAYEMGASNGQFVIRPAAPAVNPGYVSIATDGIEVHNLNFTGAILKDGAPYNASPLTTSGTHVYLASGSNLGLGGTSVPQFPLDVAGDINYTGDLRHNGQVAVFSQWASLSNMVYITSNVGIGTSAPASATASLTIAGDLAVTGNLIYGGSIQGNSSSIIGLSTNVALFDPAVGGSKPVLTNDTSYINRVIYTFDVNPGNYLVQGSIPFSNLDTNTVLDTVNWANISLYQCVPSAYTDTLTPIATFPLQAIGGQTGTLDFANLSMFFQNTASTPETYVLAVNGVGQELLFGPAGGPSSSIFIIPTRAIGLNDSYSVRQALQIQPARGTFEVAAQTSSFTLSEDGIFSVSGSNVEVYINGTKFAYVSSNQADYTLSTSYDIVNNITYFTVNLTQPVNAGDVVDIAVWPTATATNYFSSGYLYQQVNNFNTQWLTLNSGSGIRYTKDVYIDGNLYINGQQFSNYALSNVQAGSSIIGDLPVGVFVATSNIAPGAVTSAEMSATGVAAGVYGAAATTNTIPTTITVDAAGRITGLSTSANVNLTSLNVSALTASSASILNTATMGELLTNQIAPSSGTTVNASGMTLSNLGAVVAANASVSNAQVSSLAATTATLTKATAGELLTNQIAPSSGTTVNASGMTLSNLGAVVAANASISNAEIITMTTCNLIGNPYVFVTGHFLPSSNIVYDLGNSNLRFRDLYLSGNTIYLGSNVITLTDNGSLSVGSNLVAINGYFANSLTAGSLSITGGNGTAMQVAGGLSAASLTAVTGNITAANGNISGVAISASGNLSTGGDLTVSGNISATGSTSTLTVTNATITNLVANTENNSTLTVSGTLNAPTIDASVVTIGGTTAVQVNLATANATQLVNIGTGNGTKTITIGNAGDTTALGGAVSIPNATLSNATVYTALTSGPIATNAIASTGAITAPLASLSNLTVYNTITIDSVSATKVSASTIYASNLYVPGNTTVVNAYTSIASNLAIQNDVGFGPALSVSQKGAGVMYPVAEFFDTDISSNVPGLIVANGNLIGISTTLPASPLTVSGGASIGSAFAGIAAPIDGLIVSSNVGIGTTVPAYPLHVIGNIYATGDIQALSDMTMKENLEVIPDALQKLEQISGYTFTRKDDPTKKRFAGVLAQELQQVLPEVVYSNGNNLSVAYGNIIALLIEAVKELKQKLGM